MKKLTMIILLAIAGSSGKAIAQKPAIMLSDTKG